jgi:hypothetical protein
MDTILPQLVALSLYICHRCVFATQSPFKAGLPDPLVSYLDDKRCQYSQSGASASVVGQNKGSAANQ